VAAGFLRKHCGVDRSRLCYRGSSMGGFYGLKAAATGTAGFAAVALLCPATAEVMLQGLDDIESRDTEADSADGDPAAPATRWDMPGIKDYYRRENSMALASRVKCPVLLVHARGDELVPFGHGNRNPRGPDPDVRSCGRLQRKEPFRGHRGRRRFHLIGHGRDLASGRVWIEEPEHPVLRRKPVADRQRPSGSFRRNRGRRRLRV
jgi:hypothetical protein